MKVTVAICTWNRAALLDRTLAQMQEACHLPDVEWELPDVRIGVYHFPKRGYSRLLIDGLRPGCGEYIARMDANDVSLPHRIQKQSPSGRSIHDSSPATLKPSASPRCVCAKGTCPHVA